VFLFTRNWLYFHEHPRHDLFFGLFATTGEVFFYREGVKSSLYRTELELELIQTQMAQKPMLRAEVGMRVRCANKASAE